jgi:hypothetical protein
MGSDFNSPFAETTYLGKRGKYSLKALSRNFHSLLPQKVINRKINGY